MPGSSASRPSHYSSIVSPIGGAASLPAGGEHARAAARPVALFVLGLGRSGTSALARVLSLCGGALPPGLLGATSTNKRGFFEPRAAIVLNEEILRSRGTSGFDMGIPTRDESAVDPRKAARHIAKVSSYLASLPPAPLVVIKEPKTTLAAGIWFEAAAQAGFDVAAVIALRHPEEVFASIAKRANRQRYVKAAPELAAAGWLKYTLLAERDTRGVPRVFVEYTNLLQDWRRETGRIAAALAIDLDTRDEVAVDEFLTPDLRHHRYSGPILEPFGTDWMAVVYQELSLAARDQPWDSAEMDRVLGEYQLTERGFRNAFVDHQRYRNLNRFMPPFMVRLGLGTLALANRRKGTWA